MPQPLMRQQATEHTSGQGKAEVKPASLMREPMKPTGVLDQYEHFEVTPSCGREYPTLSVADLMNAPNSDELIRELGVIISHRGVVFLRKQDEMDDELQQKLIHKMGLLVGKPEANTLHIHPLANYSADRSGHINIISTDKAVANAEDLFRNHAERPLGIRGAWHTDIGYEPCPADYTCLRITKLPKVGGDTMWASSCEIYEKISPAYRAFLEGLTATFTQPRYNKTAAEKNFELVAGPRGAPENVGTKFQTTHPVVRTNPVTGYKSLFGVGNHITHINGLSQEESKRLHDYFLQLIVENIDVQVRHRWLNENDVAIWDNRCTFHSANMDFAGLGARTGRRVVGVGEKPYFDPASKTRREVLTSEGKVI